MKYYDMLKPFAWLGDIKQSQTVVKPEPEVIIKEVPVEVPVQSPAVNNTMNEEVLGLLRSIKDQIEVPSGHDKSTILNEDEVDNILNMLVKLQDNLFSGTPISHTLVKQFVWNIPREIYDISIRNFNANKPPCMNPMYWFYAFCIEMDDLTTEQREMAFINALATAVGAIPEEEYDMFVEKAEEFEALLAESELNEIPE